MLLVLIVLSAHAVSICSRAPRVANCSSIVVALCGSLLRCLSAALLRLFLLPLALLMVWQILTPLLLLCTLRLLLSSSSIAISAAMICKPGHLHTWQQAKPMC
jgi:hypothetical protein